MSYYVYTTDAVILKKRDFGEADRIYSFYTKDFGRLEINAQGVRYLKSKLRYHLSGQAILKISFIGGNEHWRLVGVEEKEVFGGVRRDNYKANCIYQILSFLERFVSGQEKDKKLWDALIESFSFVDKYSLSPIELEKFKEEILKKFLAHLGYGNYSFKGAIEQNML